MVWYSYLFQSFPQFIAGLNTHNFSDKGKEAERGEVICPRSHSLRSRSGFQKTGVPEAHVFSIKWL